MPKVAAPKPLIRKEEFTVPEAARLLGMTARDLLGLVNCGVFTPTRTAVGPKSGRRRRWISLDAIRGFNAARPAGLRVDLAALLVDAKATDQPIIPSILAELMAPPDDGVVSLAEDEFVAFFSVVVSVQPMMKGKLRDVLKSALDKMGPGGMHVLAAGLRVHRPEPL